VSIVPLTTIGEISPGADLAACLAEALVAAQIDVVTNDILVVTQKIISKAEGRYVELKQILPGKEAKRLAAVTGKDPRLVELVLSESRAVVRSAPNVLITRHRNGFVMANAGIDQSNVGCVDGGTVLLLPTNPDASAAALQNALRARLAVAPAIIISDSFGRPWRNGVVGVAIGAEGLPALIDRRGDLDRDGRPLEVTQIALGDLVASAAAMVAGEGSEGIPAVLVRGLEWNAPKQPAAALVRPESEDLFR
jgi:coenzyme F420-0:L-glutamate ligase/coenzyme F420-1:gamma-L-glutamate ligase